MEAETPMFKKNTLFSSENKYKEAKGEDPFVIFIDIMCCKRVYTQHNFALIVIY